MCTVLLPPGGYPIAVRYNISNLSYRIYHIISYHIISYHIISYHIISYHIISYHIISYHIISYHIISYHNISYHNISQSRKNSARYCHKCTQVFMCSNRYSFHILMESLFSRWIFEEYSNMKFHENPSSGSGWTDEQRDMTKLIVAYRNSANEIEKENHKYFIISTVNRKRNSHYNGLPTIFPKSF